MSTCCVISVQIAQPTVLDDTVATVFAELPRHRCYHGDIRFDRSDEKRESINNIMERSEKKKEIAARAEKHRRRWSEKQKGVINRKWYIQIATTSRRT